MLNCMTAGTATFVDEVTLNLTVDGETFHELKVCANDSPHLIIQKVSSPGNILVR